MALADIIPQAAGWLPKWQLVVAVMAVFNTVQNFMTLKFTRRVYSIAPQTVTALQARTFAIWTLTSAAIRLYAAYNIDNKVIYDLALLSYLFAFVHFGSEVLIFRTASLKGAAISPVIVSTVSMVWMISQYDYYVRS